MCASACYAAALLDDSSAGIAYTFKEALPSGCAVLQSKHPICGNPRAPELFYPLGATLLSGVVISEPRSILRQVSEGIGMCSFKGFIRKVKLPVGGI